MVQRALLMEVFDATSIAEKLTLIHLFVYQAGAEALSYCQIYDCATLYTKELSYGTRLASQFIKTYVSHFCKGIEFNNRWVESYYQ